MNADGFAATIRIIGRDISPTMPYLVAIDLPYYGLSLSVRITRGRDDQLHVSWAKDGPRYAVRTGSPKATAEWDAWILDEVRKQDVEVAA